MSSGFVKTASSIAPGQPNRRVWPLLLLNTYLPLFNPPTACERPPTPWNRARRTGPYLEHRE